MTETSERMYIELIKSNSLTPTQLEVFHALRIRPQTRQDLNETIGMSINCVCGRVKELLDEELIVVDHQYNNREVLRVKYKDEIVPKKLGITHIQMNHIKQLYDKMNDKQKLKINTYVTLGEWIE